jgi:hypothetical protein
MTVIPTEDNLDPDFKFEYLESLSNAIEIYTAKVELQDPKTFIHRNSNLKYAFERALYFSFADNSELYRFFIKWKQKELPNRIRFSSSLLREIAICITNNQLSSKKVGIHHVSTKDTVKRYIGDLKRFILNKSRSIKDGVRNLGFLLKPSSEKSTLDVKSGHEDFWNQDRRFRFSNCKVKPEIVFLIDHSRYINFLSPIIKFLTQSYAYIVIEDSNLEENLRQATKPFISCRINISANKFTYSNNLFAFRGLLSLYDLLYEKLSQLMPKTVVVVEGNFAEDEIINQVCKRLSIPVYCIQQGWSPIIHNGFRNMSFTKMFIWGKGFTNLLQPHNPHQEFVAIGSHLLGSEMTAKNDNARNAISFFLQLPYKLISQEMWLDFLRLIEWTGQNFQDVPILIREHPRYQISQSEAAKLLAYPNIKLTPPGKFSMEEVLANSCISVAIYSSTILESVAAGTVPIIVNLTSMPRYNPDLHSLRAAIEVKSIEKAKETIKYLMANPDKLLTYQTTLHQVRAKYFFDTGERVACNLVKQILN